MSSDSNTVVKKMLQKISNQLIKKSDYNNFINCDIFFVFGSKHKTAMCDFVYGLKIISKTQSRDNYLMSKLQSDIKFNMENLLDVSVCCTDVIFECYSP
jgi:hypothetical protein